MSQNRSFIAIDLPEETKAEIGKFQEKLRAQPYPIRWENPENFHLNLHFLGDTKESLLKMVAGSLQETVKKSPFELIPGHLEYLYKRHADSLVFITVEGGVKKLRELREQVCQAIELATRFDTPSKYLPHITIGRLKPTIPQQEKKNILSDIIDFQPKAFQPFTVQEVKVMQTNFLADMTHRYTTIASVPLR